MNHTCRDFRSLLEAVLEGGLNGAVVEQALTELAWHEHLLSCGECRNLLSAEEALEILLATLPEPKLPEHLARRVVSRLRHARSAESKLDALLELDRAERAPRHLAESVLARLRPARERSGETSPLALEAALDRLLDLDRDQRVPEGLAARILASLRAERGDSLGSVRPQIEPRLDTAHAESTVVRSRRVSWLSSPWSYAAAAGILATWIAWAAWQRSDTGPRSEGEHLVENGQTGSSSDGHSPRSGDGSGRDEVAQADRAPDAAMLAALDVLEHWDLLKSDDVDVLLSSSIGPADEVLLEYQDTEPAPQPPTEKEPESPSKG